MTNRVTDRFTLPNNQEPDLVTGPFVSSTGELGPAEQIIIDNAIINGHIPAIYTFPNDPEPRTARAPKSVEDILVIFSNLDLTQVPTDVRNLVTALTTNNRQSTLEYLGDHFTPGGAGDTFDTLDNKPLSIAANSRIDTGMTDDDGNKIYATIPTGNVQGTSRCSRSSRKI